MFRNAMASHADRFSWITGDNVTSPRDGGGIGRVKFQSFHSTLALFAFPIISFEKLSASKTREDAGRSHGIKWHSEKPKTF